MSLHHRKMLQKERCNEKEKALLTHRSSLTSFKSSSTKSDVEHALQVLSRNGLPYGPGPVDHYTEYRRAPRQATRQPFPTYASSLCRSTRSTSYNGKRARPLRDSRLSSRSRYSSRGPPIAPSGRQVVRSHSGGSETVLDSIMLDYFDAEPSRHSPSVSPPEALHVRREVAKSPYGGERTLNYREME